MKTSDVRNRVEQEIAENWGRSNAHGVDLRTCLVDPRRQQYRDSFDQSRTLDLWLVLEEDTRTHGGYEIVFDDNNCQYGLATASRDGSRIFLGYYGTFLETLDAM
jgi:hypothetical protein